MYSTNYTDYQAPLTDQFYQTVQTDPETKDMSQATSTTQNYFAPQVDYPNYYNQQYTNFQPQHTDLYSQQNYFNPYYSTQSQYYYNQENTGYVQQQGYNFNQMPSKPATPPPTSTVQYNNVQSFSETTPEKSINDSGIDLISPKLPLPTPPKPTQSNPMPTTSSIEESESDQESEDEENQSPNKPSPSSDVSKPPKPYLEIIADAILSSSVKMMQLHEIYHLMEKKFQYFAKNINKSWRNSVRHNLSLNECFVKAGRGSNGKGNYWKIHPLCEKEFIRGNFRRKSFKQLIRAGNSRSSAAPQVPFTDYASNYQNMPPVLPGQLVHQFNQNTCAQSFNYSFLNQNYQQASLSSVYPTETKKHSTQKYAPY